MARMQAFISPKRFSNRQTQAYSSAVIACILSIQVRIREETDFFPKMLAFYSHLTGRSRCVQRFMPPIAGCFPVRHALIRPV
jgi:hypothetical protein